MSLGAYYAIYLGSCLALILALSFALHSLGTAFLREAFHGDQALVSAVTFLLDIGFYLVSFGFMALTYKPWGWQANIEPAGEMIVWKLGLFLMFMGAVHLFNLLLLAIFRRRTLITNPQGEAKAAQ